MKLVIAPSMLSSDLSRLAEESRRTMQAGADWLHLDVMDGHFVDNLTFGAPVVRALRDQLSRRRDFLDCHLMVSDPGKWIPEFVSCADQITIHLEAVEDEDETMNLIRQIKLGGDGCRAGLAIKPSTEFGDGSVAIRVIDRLMEEGMLDYVLMMTVEPGFGGQKLIESCLDKVAWLRYRHPGLDIGVDGGVKMENIKDCALAGANVIISGSGLFKCPGMDLETAIRSMRKVLEESFRG